MQTQEVHFTVTKQDFRAANYYVHYLNSSLFYYISIGILALFAVYMVLVKLDIVSFWIPSGYIASLAVFWLLWQITKLERTVGRYARSSSSILNAKSILRFTDARMTMKVPEKAFNSSGLFADFPCAFETRTAFLVYTSGSDLFLLPLRAFSDKQKDLFRNILATTMGDRFSSRYNKNAPHIPTEAELRAEAAGKEKEEKAAAAKEAAAKEAKTPRKKLTLAERANLVELRGKNADKK